MSGGLPVRRVVLLAIVLVGIGLSPMWVPVQTESLSAQEDPGPGGPSWEELRARPFPQWFLDAKLGIFIHWGVYSVPAYSGKEDYAEWFIRGLQEGDTLRTRFLRENYGSEFQYRDFAPLFRAELFDPGDWTSLFTRAGARYVVLVSKHHDGYALWPSAYSPGWNSVEVGPERDLVGELSRAVRESGLKMGLYYSLAEWQHPLHRWYTDPPDSIGRYVTEYMVPQLKELISTYRPSLLFSDGEWLNTAEQWRARELIGWYFDTVGPDAIVNDRWGSGSDIGFKTPEYSPGLSLPHRPWAEVRGLGRSFGLNRNEKLEAYLSPEELVRSFARAVAGGGGLILNVGPKADGQIPLLQQERLLQLGEWLETNGDAIYGSRSWVRTGEHRDVTLERIDPSINFEWVRNSPGRPIREDEFSAVWTGFVEAPGSGDYSFTVEADDQASVWVDGQWAAGSEASPASISLQGGARYPIRVEYWEEAQNASVSLFWAQDGSPRELVPTSAFFTGAGPGANAGLQGKYTSRQEYLVYTAKGDDLFVITFEWPDSVLAVPIPRPPQGTTITLLGLGQDLPWQYHEGRLLVDFSEIPFSKIPGQWAWTIRLVGYAGADQVGDPGTERRGVPR